MKTANILSHAEVAYRSMWQTRALLACKQGAEYTRTGCLLINMLGSEPTSGPKFKGLLSITSDGYVLCDFVKRDGTYTSGAFVGLVSNLVANFRGLADHLKLTDVQRKELFDTVIKNIGIDYRANKTTF